MGYYDKLFDFSFMKINNTWDIVVPVVWSTLMFLFATYGLRSKEEMDELEKKRDKW